MGGNCQKHEFDDAIDICGRCLEAFCGDCVVYPFGRGELPLCLPCAVEAAGLRAGSRVRPVSRAQRRAALHQRAELRERAAATRPPTFAQA